MINSHNSINPQYHTDDDTIHQVLPTLPPNFPDLVNIWSEWIQHMTNRDQLIEPLKKIFWNLGWTLILVLGCFIYQGCLTDIGRITNRRKSYHMQGSGCKSSMPETSNRSSRVFSSHWSLVCIQKWNQRHHILHCYKSHKVTFNRKLAIHELAERENVRFMS